MELLSQADQINNAQNGDSVVSADYNPLERPNLRQDHTFSMANLLEAKLSDEKERLKSASNVQLGKSNPALPSIQETFALCTGTSLSETVVRISELVKPYNVDLPQDNAQMILPVFSSNKNLKSASNPQKPARTVHDMNSLNINDSTKTKLSIDKPPYSYVGLVILAIDSSEDKMLSVSEIRDKLKSWFPFFNGKYTGWKESVRQTLSKYSCFYKAKPDIDARSHIWAVNYYNVKPSDLVRQKRRNTNLGDFKYYLNEQVGLPPVELPFTDKMCDVKRSSELKMPPKPSFGSEASVSPILSELDHDFLCARTDDVTSQIGDLRSTQTPHTQVYNPPDHNSQLYKRPAEHTFSQPERNPKRRKTVAEVNPFLSTHTTSAEVYMPETSQMTLTQNYNRTYTRDITAYCYNGSTNPDDSPCNRNEVNAYPTYQPLEFYNHLSQNWPYNIDTLMYNQTPSPVYNGYHGLQAFNIPQYSALPSYSVWPYQNSYPALSGFSSDTFGVWNGQAYEPQLTPVNLCKNSDN